MKRFALLFTALALITISSCKEDEPESPANTQTTKQKITALWQGVSVYYEEQEPGEPLYSETYDISGYNLNFTSNGIIVIDSAGIDPETYQWDVTDDDKLIWIYSVNDHDTFDIVTLTNSEFVIEDGGFYVWGVDTITYLDRISMKK